MHFFTAIIWMALASFKRFQLTEDLVDYHLIGNILENQAQVNIIVQPQFFEEDQVLATVQIFKNQDGKLKFLRKQILKKEKSKPAIKVHLRDLDSDSSYLLKYQVSLYENEAVN